MRCSSHRGICPSKNLGVRSIGEPPAPPLAKVEVTSQSQATRNAPAKSKPAMITRAIVVSTSCFSSQNPRVGRLESAFVGRHNLTARHVGIRRHHPPSSRAVRRARAEYFCRPCAKTSCKELTKRDARAPKGAATFLSHKA